MTTILKVPGSKSMTQRALVIAALADRASTIQGALDCDDSRYLTQLLSDLGVNVTAHWSTGEISVTPPRSVNFGDQRRIFSAPSRALYCGNAGTTMRFSSALALLSDGPLVLDGDERMRQRPIGALGDALKQLNLDVTYLDKPGCPPLRLTLKGEPAATATVDSSLSSQYASGLLLVAPLLPKGLTLSLSGSAVSRPYLEMTLSMMEEVGARIRREGTTTLHVDPKPYAFPRGTTVQTIEADWSGAAFILGAARIAGQTVTIENLSSPSESLQGDSAFADFLAELEQSRVHEFDLSDVPDLIAPLVAVALFADQPTRIRGAAHTRIKESDRIAVLTNELRKIGAQITELPDGMDIQPLTAPRHFTVTLDPANDHRMAMAFGLVSLRVPGITVANPECVRKSYPHFWEDLKLFRSQHESRHG